MVFSLWQYLLKQTAGPLVFFTCLLTGLVWLTQSLQMLDLIVNRGQSAVTFLHLSLLILPSLLAVILPIALFAAVLLALHRLQSDSELVVMFAAGLSKMRLVIPVIALACATMAANYAVNLYLMPAGYRTMKDRVYEIRGDLAAGLVREGRFSAPMDGLTVYIREAPPGGDLRGIMVHDNRDPKQPTTYMAERGVLITTDEGPRLVMSEGIIHWMANRDGRLTVLDFDKYTFDLSQYAQPRKAHNRDMSERFLPELFKPDLTKKYDRKNKDELLAEGHNRLASPLYNIAFALVAFVAVAGGTFSRRGYAKRIGLAIAAVLLIRLGGFGVQSVAVDSPELNLLQYLLPVLTAAVCLYLLTAGQAFSGRESEPPEDEEEDLFPASPTGSAAGGR